MGISAACYSVNAYYIFCLRTEKFIYKAESLAPWFGDKNGTVGAIGIIGTVSIHLKVIYNKCFSVR